MRLHVSLIIGVFLSTLQSLAQSGQESEPKLRSSGRPARVTINPERASLVAPLLTTLWGEGCFYNASCPTDTGSHPTCLHTPAGSGSVAMAQVMKYYGFPAHGYGEHGYPHPQYGIQYANFGATNYQWNTMPDSLTTGNTDLATLVYQCCVAQNMNFGTYTSTSSMADLDSGLVKYFGFPKTAVWKQRSAYPAAEWTNMLKAELDAGHPLLYTGFNNTSMIQRYFVCDGYQGEDSFHFNWGLNGIHNGYYSLNALMPDTINFSYAQHALFNLAPSPPVPASIIMDFENVADFSLTFNEWTVRDVDQHDTYGIENYTFPNQNTPMAFLCFNPATVVPSMASDLSIQPHGGQRFGACFSSNPPANNDWFISPQVQLGVNGTFSFWVKSYNNTWGLDNYKVAVSTTDSNPASFTLISGTDPLQTTTEWTRKVFNLTAYNNQKVFVAIQCVSDDHFLMMIDDLEIKPDATSLLTADFSADKTTVRVGEAINFTDQSSGVPTSWIWSFQGATPNGSLVQNPGNIKYSTPGFYNVKLTISNGIASDSVVKSSYITVTGFPTTMSLNFESLTDFTMNFYPWTLTDVGGGNTYGIQGVSFPNNYLPMAYICFNPATTTPPLVNMTPHSGQKLGCSFSTTPPLNPNNKWLISPKMSLGVNPRVEFWVKSYNNAFGDEKYRVAVSTTDVNPSSFVPLMTEPESAPTVWTQRTYGLTGYSNQDVFIGIQCVTDNGFIFMIDDIYITSSLGVNDADPGKSVAVFPNPASGFVHVKFPGIQHSNLKIELIALPGTVVKSWHYSMETEVLTLDIHDVPRGFYILRFNAGGIPSEAKISVIH